MIRNASTEKFSNSPAIHFNVCLGCQNFEDEKTTFILC
jgi:hypothetical protein